MAVMDMAGADRLRTELASGPTLGEGIEAVRAPVTQARHLPGYVYTSPEVYALEKEKIFMKDWLCVARAEEIENPGDFMTHDIMGDPIVIARDEDGKLNAFSNLCRHRGVEVAQGCGNTKEFSCPYHGWLYDLKGRLTGAPYMKETEGFDPKTCRLKPLLIDVWAGWVFVNFDLAAVSLREFLGEYGEVLDFLKMEDLRVAERLVYELDCNWKFVAENLVDTYHSGTVHADTFGSYIDMDEAANYALGNGAFYVFYDAAPHTRSGKPLFGKIPALKDRPESFALASYHTPNMHLFARIENMRPCVHWPLGPGRVRLIYYNLFPKEFFDRPDFQDGLAEYREYYTQVVEEDTEMIESLHRAMSTKMFEPGPMSRLEKGVHDVINYNLNRTFTDA